MSEVVAKEKKEKRDKSEKKEKSEKKDKKEKHHHHHSAPAAPQPVAPVEEEDWDANRTRIENICKTPPNNMCNDCNQPGTRWASVNHGVFVCIRCSGIHRSLGVHISKVKSTNMDKWTSSEIRLMELIGNRRAKDLYEARLPKGFKPLSGQESEATIRGFIVNKYDSKSFSTEGVSDILKKMYKQSGYGRKGGVPSVSATPGSPVAVKSHEDPMKSLYGSSSTVSDKKKKKEKAVEGCFGSITVPADEHDQRLATLLAHFGVELAAAPAAVEPAEANTTPAAA